MIISDRFAFARDDRKGLWLSTCHCEDSERPRGESKRTRQSANNSQILNEIPAFAGTSVQDDGKLAICHSGLACPPFAGSG